MHLWDLGLQGETGLQGLQVRESPINPAQALRDFTDVPLSQVSANLIEQGFVEAKVVSKFNITPSGACIT